jgi:glycosyltransferase involved in cell wall biosynthesis
MRSVLVQLGDWLRPFGSVEVLAHGPNRGEVPFPTRELPPRRLSAPFRFPDVLIYVARMGLTTWRTARRARNVVLLPQDSVATGFAVALAGRLAGRPVVVMEHGTAQAIRTRFFWQVRLPPARLRDRLTRPILRRTLLAMNRATLRMADFALVPSDESVDLYRSWGVPEGRVIRYHVPIDLERFRPAEPNERPVLRRKLGLPEDATIIVSVSRLTPEKGIDGLIEAAREVDPNGRLGLRIVIAGEGHLRERLEWLADRLGVPAQFIGFVPPDVLPELLRASEVFAYSARQGTNVPVATLEAMASGLAIVATTEPIAHVEMLAEGRGTAIAPDDVDALARALRAYAADERARAEAGRRARAWVATHHAPEVLEGEMRNLIAALGD